MYTKILSSKRKISDIKAYLVNDKTNPEIHRNIMESTFLCGKNWADEMTANAAIWCKEDGVKYHQIILASDPSQVPPPSIKNVHFAGKRVAELFSQKGFQVAVETHADTEQIHNHIIVGSVNVYDGHKLQISKAKSAKNSKKADFRFVEITDAVDEICKRYNLLTLTESKQKKTKRQKANHEQPTNQLNIYIKDSYQRAVQDSLIAVWDNPNIFNQEDFERALEKQGIKISRITKKGDITYQDQKWHRVRANKIGAFNLPDINDLIDLNEELRKKQEDEQAKEEAKEEQIATAKAKEDHAAQQRMINVMQYANEQADNDKKQKEIDKKRLAAEKKKLLNAINEIMNSGFIGMSQWVEEQQKRDVCIMPDTENNIIYKFNVGTVKISSKDYPDYSRKAVIEKAGKNKVRMRMKEKQEAEKQTRPTKNIEHEQNRGKGLSRSRRR